MKHLLYTSNKSIAGDYNAYSLFCSCEPEPGDEVLALYACMKKLCRYALSGHWLADKCDVNIAGPVTILNWSFPRKDITRQAQAFQLALAIREEVADLEKAGCRVIQVLAPSHLLCVFPCPQSQARFWAWYKPIAPKQKCGCWYSSAHLLCHATLTHKMISSCLCRWMSLHCVKGCP